uniref:Uncharacterized protein n=1 Tax=Rhizophora mucronata TaxID=61149 RepID=A0A2P2JTS9_RHIMU
MTECSCNASTGCDKANSFSENSVCIVLPFTVGLELQPVARMLNLNHTQPTDDYMYSNFNFGLRLT